MKLKILGSFSLITLVMFLGPAARAQQVTPSITGCDESVNNRLSINWPQFHFDHCLTGYNPYETVLSPQTVGNLVLAWKFQTILGQELITSSPAVANGFLYFGAHGYGNVYALNARTGALAWYWENDHFSAGSPAVGYGKVYVADNAGGIRVLNAANGNLIGTWGYDVPSDVTVFNGALYVTADNLGGTGHIGEVYALDANTGEFLWNFPQQSTNLYASAVADGRVYVECEPTRFAPLTLCALDASTGTMLWQFSPQNLLVNAYPPAVSNGVVYVGATQEFNDYRYYESNVYALDAATGDVIWQRPLTGTVDGGNYVPQTTPAIANDVVYIGSNGYVYALNARTGAILWKYRAGASSSAVVANGVVYFGSR